MTQLNQDVKPVSDMSPEAIKEDEKIQPQEGEPAPQPGEKTESSLLLKSLQEERERRRILEEENKQLRESLVPSEPPDEEVFSDEGKLLKKEISSLKSELSEVRGELTKAKVLEKYPILKEKWEEFEEFRLLSENKGMNLATAAKAFVVEKELLESPPQRKGLEKLTGGAREVPVSESGYTVEEVRKLREEQPKLWEKLVREKRLKIISSK